MFVVTVLLFEHTHYIQSVIPATTADGNRKAIPWQLHHQNATKHSMRHSPRSISNTEKAPSCGWAKRAQWPSKPSQPVHCRSTLRSESAACHVAASSRSTDQSHLVSPPSPCMLWPKPSATVAFVPTSMLSTQWTLHTQRPLVSISISSSSHSQTQVSRPSKSSTC